jgi:ATP-binding cassette, subfamily B, bacterial PglK
MENLKKLLFLLKPKEKRSGLILLVLVIIMGLIEVAGILSIMPFVVVLSNPEIIETNSVLKNFYEISRIFGVNSVNKFLFFLGIVVLLVLSFSLIIKTLTLYAQIRYSAMREFTIGKSLIEQYIHQPYVWFLNRNSSEIGTKILNEVNFVVGNGIKPLVALISQSIIVLFLFTLLIIADVKTTFIMASLFIIFYGLIYQSSKKFLSKIGKERTLLNSERFKIVAEAFGAAKEIKIARLEGEYVKRFVDVALPLAKQQTMTTVISNVPRYALELITFGGMLLITLYFLRLNKGFNDIVPIITLYAFAGYRLMPALQIVFTALTTLKYLGPGLDSLYKDIKSLEPLRRNIDKYSLKPEKYILLNDIDFTYPNETKKTLNKINLKIPVNNIVGIVGSTGSGKSTTVDIILGLLEPEKGSLQIDDKIINRYNKRAWQNSIGYVPQQICLADDTISSNIAFGIEPQNIKYNDIERAAKLANIHDFINQDLPLKYNTIVGERGVRLSGGQRQRIGIARALYTNPKILIFDEATNSLDNYTENAVLQAITYNKDMTIILITHRLTTLKECDNIFLIDKGELKGEGKFKELEKNNNYFKQLLNEMSKN